MTLAPCPSCRRHVRDSSCPFCGVMVDAVPPRSSTAARLSRAAVIASALTGCWTSSEPQHPTTSPIDTATVAPDNKVGTATIRGVVRTTDGAIQPQREVTLAGNGTTRHTRTDDDGRYELHSLPAGTYTLTVTPMPDSGNPRNRPPPVKRSITLTDGEAQTIDLAVQPYAPGLDNACCMPYGAPPRRRRVV